MKYLSNFLFVVCVLLLYVSPISANEIRGKNDPKFQTAMTLWLAGEDESALKSFAALARKDNRAAQTFLGQLESKTWLHHHITKNLSRKKRIALLRNPRGLSGTSWLSSAATDTPLAQLFIETRTPYNGPNIGLQLLDAGEISAALPSIVRAINVGDPFGGLRLIVHQNAVPYSLGILKFTVQLYIFRPKIKQFEVNHKLKIEVQAKIASLPASSRGDQIMWGVDKNARVPRDVMNEPKKLGNVGEHLLSVAALQPIVSIIKQHCPNEEAEALATLQIYHAEPLAFGTFSPVEAILSSFDYSSSDRFKNDVVRYLGFSIQKEGLKRLNFCAYDLIESAS